MTLYQCGNLCRNPVT